MSKTALRISNGIYRAISSDPLIGIIAGIGGCKLWVNGSSVVLEGSEVVQMVDRSGNGNHMIPVAAQPNPTYAASGIGGKPTLSFTEGAGFEIATSPFITVTWTFFCVFTRVDDVARTLFGSRDTSTGDIAGITVYPLHSGGGGFFTGNTINAGAGGAGYSDPNTVVVDTPVVGAIRVGGGANTAYLNAEAGSTGGTGVPAAMTGPFRIGNRNFGDGTGYWVGDIAEFIGFDAKLSDDDTLAVNLALLAKYGLTSNL